MRIAARLGALLTLVSALPSGNARASEADSSWVTVQEPNPCDVSGGTISARGQSLSIGGRPRDLHAAVSIVQKDDGYQTEVVIHRGLSRLGQKQTLSASCHEAVEVAVVVIGMALHDLASPPTPPAEDVDPVVHRPMAATPAHSSPGGRSTAPPHRHWFQPAQGVRGGPAADAATAPLRDSERPPIRVQLMSGLDGITLPTPSLTIGLGVMAVFDPIELRVLARYGLPNESEHESVSPMSPYVERSRHELATTEFDVCYGLGETLRVSTCVGPELGAVLRQEEVRTTAKTTDESEATLVVAGVLTAIASYRESWVQPQLEVGGSVMGVGAQQGDSPLGLRATAGAAIQF